MDAEEFLFEKRKAQRALFVQQVFSYGFGSGALLAGIASGLITEGTMQISYMVLSGSLLVAWVWKKNTHGKRLERLRRNMPEEEQERLLTMREGFLNSYRPEDTTDPWPRE